MVTCATASGRGLRHEGPRGVSKYDVPLAHLLRRAAGVAASDVRSVPALVPEDAEHSDSLHG